MDQLVESYVLAVLCAVSRWSCWGSGPPSSVAGVSNGWRFSSTIGTMPCGVVLILALLLALTAGELGQAWPVFSCRRSQGAGEAGSRPWVRLSGRRDLQPVSNILLVSPR